MPPKAKFTGDEIIEAALTILRQKGISAVTAREIGMMLTQVFKALLTERLTKK